MTTGTHNDTVFSMPSLGADMTEGRITEWLVGPGDAVERGQIVVVVETEKSDIEVEVFESATIIELLVAEGEMVPVGTPIARFGPPGSPQSPIESAAERAATPQAPPPAPEPSAPAVPAGESAGNDDGAVAPHVTSPVIRHLAEQLHVDAERVHGTGAGGRVHRDDVEAAAATSRRRITPRARRLLHERGIDAGSLAASPLVTGDDVLALPPGKVPSPEPRDVADKPTRAETMRRHIADLMTRSWTEIPHYHVSKRIDLTVAVERLTAANEERSVADRIVPGTLLLCAAARAAAKVQGCNGWWLDQTFVPADDVKMGIVLSLRSGGILVPTVDRPHELTPAEMMARLAELVQRARQGRLRASDMAEASITVTNLGDRGADSVSGVIHPPQVAIVGFGAVHDEVWPVDQQPVVRPTVIASLAGDHRATDGLTGSRYLSQVQSLLDGPLLEEL